MNLFLLKDFDNFLGRKIIEYFSKENNVFLFEKINENFNDKVFYLENFYDIPSIPDLYKENNIFLFGTKFLNEYDIDDISYIDLVINDLTQKYQTLQFLSRNFIEKDVKGCFYFFTFNSINLNKSNFPTKPIEDSAIETFVKSVSKELTTFDIYSYCIRLDPIFETMDFKEIREFRKSMNIFSLRKTPTKILDILNFLNVLFHNNFKLLSGSIINIGEGMSF